MIIHCKHHWGRSVVLALLTLTGSAAIAQDNVNKPGNGAAACPDTFNYLLGEWTTTYDGRLQNIKWEAPAGSCYLIEHWLPASEVDSPFFALLAYDIKLKNWSYLAASPRGERLRFENGVRHGEEMRFVQEDMSDGFKYRFSYSPLQDGGVREWVMRSKDGGKTWEQSDELRWKKKQ